MLKSAIFSVLTLSALWVSGADIYLAGDSTMCEYSEKQAPQQGWGHFMQEQCKPGVKVVNMARGGRSAKSFRSELWGKLLEQAKEGDFVIIQFGHNDGNKKDPKRYARGEEFRSIIKEYVADCRAKKLNPVLVTSTPRWSYDKEKKTIYIGGLGTYTNGIRKVAEEENVPMVDMNQLGVNQMLERGMDATKGMYMVSAGKKDNLHITAEGAKNYAQWFAADAKARKLPIAELLQ